jgi:hypothetical protein
MMHLCIPVFSATTSTRGWLSRIIAIADTAQQVGQSVTFCASGNLPSTLRQRGLCIFPVPPATLAPLQM